MSNRSADIVFHLIKSLEKAEKRHFKLYITRNSAKQDLKIIQLFDAMDKLEEYDEKWLLKKMGAITKPQLANMKTHLYKQVLASLRLLKTAESTDLQLSEQLDYARILYHKGLKLQALKILEKAKELAKANSKFNYLAQVISLEKKIENLHITRTSQEKIEQITQESLNISEHIQSVSKLSNLALLLYRWYTQHG
ncbi:MAG TPA: hypothetical protein DCL43_13980, partial [Chitinophagaceae bacterium]|nr:hypothetical protein [Chitinophagaceae bacterium]